MAIKPIQAIDGGPEYDHWATADQMERLIKSLMTSGISQADAKNLTSLLDNIQKGGKVDTQVLRQVLGNLKTTSRQDSEQYKAADRQDKAERNFWQKSNQHAQAATRAFKNANIADALKGTRDLGMIPIESLSDAFTKVTSIVSTFGAGIFGAANSIIKSLGSIGAGVGKVLGFFGGIIAGIGGVVTTAIGALVGAIDGMGDVFFTLYNTGINMAAQQGNTTSGLGALASAANNARMTIGEFGEFIAENTRITVAIGAQAMGELSKAVRKSLIPMGQLGLSMSETNEYMADWLEMSRVTNTLDLMDRTQQAQGAQEYLILLTQLSKITGRRRDQIAAELQQRTINPSFQAWINGIPEAIRGQVRSSALAMSGWFGEFGKEFGDDITDAFVNKGGLAVTKFGKSLLKVGLTEEFRVAQQLIDDATAGKISKAEMLLRLVKLKEMVLANDAMTDTAFAFATAGSDAGDSAVTWTTALRDSETNLGSQGLAMDKATKLIGNFSELTKTLTQTWTTFLDGMFTDPLFKKAMNDLSTSFTDIMHPDKPLAQNLSKLAIAAGPEITKGLQAMSDHLGTASFQSIMEQIPDMFAALGNALKGALEYLRGLFFKKEIQTSGMEGFQVEKWVLKSGSEIMDGLKASFMSLWATMTDPDGVIVKSLIKGFDALGTYMVEPITNIMVGAFTAIGASLLSSAKELFMKIVRRANPMNWFSSDADARAQALEGLDDPGEPGEDDFTGFEKVAIYGVGGIVGYKLMRKGWNKIVTTGKVAPLVQGGNANLLAQQQAEMKALNKPQSKWRRFANKIKGLPKSVRGNAIMGLFLGGIVLASEIMDLGDIDETTPDTVKHREQREVAEAGGAMAGMAAGAALGSIIPGLGTAIGGIIGGLLGWWLGEKAGGALYDAILNPTAVVRDARDRATRGVHEVAGEAIIHGDSDVEENAVANYQGNVKKNLKLQEYQDKYDKYSKSKNPRRVKLAAEYKDKIEQLTRKLSLTTKTEEERAAIVEEVVAGVVTATIAATRPVTRTSGGVPIDAGGDYGASDAYTAPGGIGSRKRNTFAEFQNLGAPTLESNRLLKELKGTLDLINANLVELGATTKTGNVSATTSANKLKAAILESSVYVR
jgi:hypothetical protein